MQIYSFYIRCCTNMMLKIEQNQFFGLFHGRERMNILNACDVLVKAFKKNS